MPTPVPSEECWIVISGCYPPYPEAERPGAKRPAHGMVHGPEAMLAAGLEEALEAAGLPVSRLIFVPARSEGPRAALPAVAGRLAAEVEVALRAGAFPLVLGDCTATVGGTAGLTRVVNGPALVWCDAHGDLNTPETSPSGYLGGMPLGTIIGRGAAWWREGAGEGLPLPEAAVVLVGARDLDPAERDVLAQGGVRLLEAASFRDPAARRAALAAAGEVAARSGGLYFHVDLDVLDPEVFRSVYFPVPGGLEPGDLYALARQCRVSLPASPSASRPAAAAPAVALAVAAYDPLAGPEGWSGTMSSHDRGIGAPPPSAARVVEWTVELAKILARKV